MTRTGTGFFFAQAVDRYLAEKGKEFGNEKHASQWRTTLAEASKVLGPKRVDEIDVQDVLRVLRPMWHQRTETASRLRGRIERVLAWATVNGYRTGDNPARWRGHLAEALPKPSKIAEAGQQPALTQDDLPRGGILKETSSGYRKGRPEKTDPGRRNADLLAAGTAMLTGSPLPAWP